MVFHKYPAPLHALLIKGMEYQCYFFQGRNVIDIMAAAG